MEGGTRDRARRARSVMSMPICAFMCDDLV
jgi:hypothetical protein